MKTIRIITIIVISIMTIMITSCKKDKTTGIIEVSTTVEGYGAISGVETLLYEYDADTYVKESYN